MMTVKTTNNLSVLLRSYEALHNWRALVMLAGSALLAGLAMAGGSIAVESSGSYAVMGLMGLLAFIIALVGMNASGLMLVDQAYDQTVRGFGAAFMGGLQAALYAVGALILLGLGFAAIVLGVFVLSLLGRIPGIGGFFGFMLAGPSVVLVAMAYVVLLFAVPLMVVAIWHGEGLLGSLSHAADIVLKKPLEVFMHVLVLGLLVFPVAVLIFGLVFGASMLVGGMYGTGALSGATLDGGGHGPMGMFMNSMASYGFGGAGISISLVLFLAWSVVGLIYVLGMIFVYRAVSEGVESEAAGLVRERLSQLRQKMDAYKPRGGASASAADTTNAESTVGSGTPERGESMDAAQAPAPAAEPHAAARCPACGAEVRSVDAFCGNCGHPLR